MVPLDHAPSQGRLGRRSPLEMAMNERGSSTQIIGRMARWRLLDCQRVGVPTTLASACCRRFLLVGWRWHLASV